MGSSDENEILVEEDDSESDQDDIYKVADILEEQEWRFYVSWAGYDSDKNIWEPESNLKLEIIAEKYSIEAPPNQVAEVMAARIRPPLNMLKLRASKFVMLGRNVAVDGSTYGEVSLVELGLVVA
ncbi:hypothetical protein GN244_ATG14580 [Phytophthora infestans]|uniref:Chromo domain-containing protein n=1 Tax=Phytophthora infestans TaxID=4787 RepID=A0A833SHA8_PHYIN|nr:hypothetical protein GN244_ATG14580 [Phytophthora infestans]KAF4144522.1 hypothetical protein GN958_ATG06267 [Phytophthora infestans]